MDRWNAHCNNMSQYFYSFIIHLYYSPNSLSQGTGQDHSQKNKTLIVEFGLFDYLEGATILFLKWKRQTS